MPKSSSLATKEFIEPSDFKEIDLITSRQNGIDQNLENWLGQSMDNYNIVATYNLLTNALILVRSGLGYAFCINGVANLKGTTMKFVPLKPKMTSGVSLIWSKKNPLSEPANKFLALLRQQIYPIR